MASIPSRHLDHSEIGKSLRRGESTMDRKKPPEEEIEEVEPTNSEDPSKLFINIDAANYQVGIVITLRSFV
jgi:hypothetical protein